MNFGANSSVDAYLPEDVADNMERLSVHRVSPEGRQDVEDVVVKELPLTIILNNRELVTLLCSPTDLKHLAIGFLASEGLLENKDEIRSVVVDQRRGVARVDTTVDKESAGELLFKRFITSGCGRGASFYSSADVQAQEKIESEFEISTQEVFNLIRDFQHRSQVYRMTGGVHSAALCDSKDILLFSEDIGRHNAIDKIFGQCILENMATIDRIIISSGRISSEMLLKVSRRKIPILISRSAPTNIGVGLAGDLGVTLIGFARGKKMNIYANSWRIID